jgi:hypothetical protein
MCTTVILYTLHLIVAEQLFVDCYRTKYQGSSVMFVRYPPPQVFILYFARLADRVGVPLGVHTPFLPTCLMLCLYSLIPNIILYALIIL